jgi:hypothetical protein
VVVEFVPPAFGWVNDPVAVNQAMAAMTSGDHDPVFATAAEALKEEVSDTAPVFFWRAEEKVLGKRLGSWDQGQVGTCVSFGFARGVQDLLLWEVAAGEAEEWPGAQIATEPIYGGSRVEVGGGRIRGDGSVGAWAARWVKDWGVIPRGKYGAHDLTTYSESMSRRWGDRGVPDELEPRIKEHPVTAVAMVQTGEDLWTAIGAGKPVPVCSDQGFTSTRDADGFCRRSGSWAHCMLYRGRFIHPRRGKCLVEQNSWGGYLKGPDEFEYVAEDGSVKKEKLPEGCFCVELSVGAAAVSERDSFALAGLTGWDVVKMNWTP